MGTDANPGLMRPNIGARDRMVRFGIGVILTAIGIYVTYRINAWVGALIVLLGAFSIFEALYGWCVVYALLGKNTCPVIAD
jgi:heme A synthase